MARRHITNDQDQPGLPNHWRDLLCCVLPMRCEKEPKTCNNFNQELDGGVCLKKPASKSSDTKIQSEYVEESLINTNDAVEATSLKIPAEILEKVFCLLPPRDLKTVTMVCKFWKEVGERPQLWTWACFKIDCHHYYGTMIHEMFSSRRHHHIKKIKVVRSDFRSNEVAVLETLMAALDECPGLFESLDLAHNLELSKVSYNVLTKAVTKLVEVRFSNLSHLTPLQVCAIFGTLLDNSGLLKRLEMNHVDISFVPAKVVAKVINKLEEADLTGANLSSHQITALFTKMMKKTNLKKLNLSLNLGVRLVNQELVNAALTRVEEIKLPNQHDVREFMHHFGYDGTWPPE